MEMGTHASTPPLASEEYSIIVLFLKNESGWAGEQSEGQTTTAGDRNLNKEYEWGSIRP